ncbi:hypothetical protein B0H16DRAFT_1743540 [Mycena metata]|uniref:Uncharacterized protein n=1 Tax=Mycena metata TaxID=1033252 RepID=A0AAD7ME84_9AGAR|nr:hypothetical protein B0H16DRAFT_1743540 [Mycena metata]
MKPTTHPTRAPNLAILPLSPRATSSAALSSSPSRSLVLAISRSEAAALASASVDASGSGSGSPQHLPHERPSPNRSTAAPALNVRTTPSPCLSVCVCVLRPHNEDGTVFSPGRNTGGPMHTTPLYATVAVTAVPAAKPGTRRICNLVCMAPPLPNTAPTAAASNPANAAATPNPALSATANPAPALREAAVLQCAQSLLTAALQCRHTAAPNPPGTAAPNPAPGAAPNPASGAAPNLMPSAAAAPNIAGAAVSGVPRFQIPTTFHYHLTRGNFVVANTTADGNPSVLYCIYAHKDGGSSDPEDAQHLTRFLKEFLNHGAMGLTPRVGCVVADIFSPASSHSTALTRTPPTVLYLGSVTGLTYDDSAQGRQDAQADIHKALAKDQKFLGKLLRHRDTLSNPLELAVGNGQKRVVWRMCMHPSTDDENVRNEICEAFENVKFTMHGSVIRRGL